MATSQVEDQNWQFNKSVLDRNRYMLENRIATDVTFIVGRSQGRKTAEKIVAHKYILISGSSVFMSMFYGDIAEQGQVTVPDVEPHAFMEMLRFLYYEEADLTSDSVMPILYAAKKYLIPSLNKICTDFLDKDRMMTTSNVCEILDHSVLFDEAKIVSKCMAIIEDKSDKVMRSESFKLISQATLCRILDRDELSMSEVNIFKACIKWAKSQIEDEERLDTKEVDGSCIHEKLGPALYHIRFSEMTPQEFVDVVVPTRILTKDEEIQIFRYFSQGTKPTDLPFLTRPRGKFVGNVPNRQHGVCLVPTIDYPQKPMCGYIACIVTLTNTSAFPIYILGFKVSGHVNIIEPKDVRQKSDTDGIYVKVKIKKTKILPTSQITYKFESDKNGCVIFGEKSISFICDNVSVEASNSLQGIPFIGIYFSPTTYWE